MQQPDNEEDRILSKAVRFLMEGNENEAAIVLLSCSLYSIDLAEFYEIPTLFYHEYCITLTGPRAAFDIFQNESHPISKSVRHALEAVHFGTYITRFDVQVEYVDLSDNWRQEFFEDSQGKDVHNQVTYDPQAKIWNTLRFHSQSEIQVATALDKAKLLFLPNCLARLNTPEGRRNKEPDFLICHNGKWGIIEVDGEPFHPPSRTVQDHERDRLFKAHGITVVEHFDAGRCYNDPEGVVQEFLKILERA